ncbi:MAG: 2Fe-2S iron-sulfur cluster-binding protein, partial [Alphaproteobacteria bacterium]
MTGNIPFILNGIEIEARPGESIWQAAERGGVDIPHMCYGINDHYRADGSCRLCLVEIDGERKLAPSCKRTPSAGMRVRTDTGRVQKTRDLMMELLLGDQPARDDGPSLLKSIAGKMGVTDSRFPARRAS